MKYSKKDVEYAKTRLLEYLPKNATIFMYVQSVAKSGMSRWIKPIIFYEYEGEKYHHNIGYYIAKVCGLPLNTNGAVQIRGCGMDMGFALVYDLAYRLYDDPYALKYTWL